MLCRKKAARFVSRKEAFKSLGSNPEDIFRLSFFCTGEPFPSSLTKASTDIFVLIFLFLKNRFSIKTFFTRKP